MRPDARQAPCDVAPSFPHDLVLARCRAEISGESPEAARHFSGTPVRSGTPDMIASASSSRRSCRDASCLENLLNTSRSTSFVHRAGRDNCGAAKLISLEAYTKWHRCRVAGRSKSRARHFERDHGLRAHCVLKFRWTMLPTRARCRARSWVKSASSISTSCPGPVEDCHDAVGINLGEVSEDGLGPLSAGIRPRRFPVQHLPLAWKPL